MTALKGKFAFTEYVRDGASPIYAFPTNTFRYRVDLRSNIVRAGLNYEFGP